MGNSNKNSSERKKRKRNSKIIIAIICIIALICIISIAWIYGNNLLSKMKRVEIDESDLGIKEEVTEKIETSEIKDIVNIAILGVDETGADVGRSDATMIATFDPVHKKLKITSIMRDAYIDIPGHDKDKLNHAYAYGGHQLTLKTLNQNFGLNIKDYVKINFQELEGLVDAIGGIDIELSDEEITELDNYIVLVSEALNMPTEKLIKDQTTGKVHLNGFQTLGYCRIRSTAGGDFDRTERHRKIMTEMFNKISTAGTSKLASMATNLLPYVETSLSNKEILNLAANVLNLGTKDIEQERFPRDEYSHNSSINDIFYLCYDEAYTEEQVHEYIFNDRKMWLEPNQKVYNHDAEHFHGNGVSNYKDTNTQTITPNTNAETEVSTPYTNNVNNSNINDNTQGEETFTDTIESPTEDAGATP